MRQREKIIWAFYDFASTPVAFAINALYLPLMIIGAGGTNTLVGVLPLVTGSIAALWTPIVGLLIDRAPSDSFCRRILILISVLVAGLSIIMMTRLNTSLSGLVLLFTLMSIGIQTGWTAVNSYLASEGEEKNMGALSGIGIVFGYIGGAIGAGGAVIIERLASRNHALIFIGLFLILFALIPAVLLKDLPKEAQIENPNLAEILHEIKDNTSIKMYLLGSILWGDAISTIMTFASLIANQVLLIPLDNIAFVVGLALPFAIIGGYAQGHLGDKYGIVRIQGINLGVWAVGFASIVIFGALMPIIAVTCVAGFALGGNVTLTRALYAKIIPVGMEGRLFGISAIFTFFGGAVGPVLTGFFADLPGWNLQLALVVPLIFVILSIPTLKYINENSSVPFQGISTQKEGASS
ncbi:MAG: MFS transporter [Candidatus Lokiarchaeota archaeon]|nr:MFS transporter [Candidatus Lokiarchaeota archaeon]